MHKTLVFLLTLILSGFSFSLYADTSKPTVITVAGYDIPQMIETPEKGLFVALIKEAGKRFGYEVKVDVLPAKRAIHEFKKGHYDAVMPMTGTYQPVIDGPRSHYIYVKRTFAFIRKGDTPPTSIPELHQVTVGLNEQYDNSPLLLNDSNINFVWGEDDTEMMKMLSNKRFDAFVIEENSGLKALHDSKVENITYNPDFPITSTPAYILFQNTDEGQRLADDISKALVSMKIDGSFNRIMGIL